MGDDISSDTVRQIEIMELQPNIFIYLKLICYICFLFLTFFSLKENEYITLSSSFFITKMIKASLLHDMETTSPCLLEAICSYLYQFLYYMI